MKLIGRGGGNRQRLSRVVSQRAASWLEPLASQLLSSLLIISADEN